MSNSKPSNEYFENLKHYKKMHVEGHKLSTGKIRTSDETYNGKSTLIFAKLIKEITYSEVISKNLRVMDLTAISLAKESSIPIYITNIFEEDSLIRALKEEGNYSKIH